MNVEFGSKNSENAMGSLCIVRSSLQLNLEVFLATRRREMTRKIAADRPSEGGCLLVHYSCIYISA